MAKVALCPSDGTPAPIATAGHFLQGFLDVSRARVAGHPGDFQGGHVFFLFCGGYGCLPSATLFLAIHSCPARSGDVAGEMKSQTDTPTIKGRADAEQSTALPAVSPH